MLLKCKICKVGYFTNELVKEPYTDSDNDNDTIKY